MSKSIIDTLNESIQNFKVTRSRNRSKPSPNPRSRENSYQKLNSSSESDKNLQLSYNNSSQKPVQTRPPNSSSSKAHYRQDSFTKILESDSFVEYKTPEKFDFHQKTAEFNLSPEDQDVKSLFEEIESLKKDQKSLESQVTILESKICENLKDLHEPLKQSDFSDIINRITGLQGKFANRNKTALSTEKLSDLFEKISNLESEAESIRKENSEVENLYNQSLNEIYEKIEKLKTENKTLTDIILSNSSNSPKQNRKNVYSSVESLTKVQDRNDESKGKIDLFDKERQELEAEKFRLELELGQIPVGSKSMASKKKRQGLEKELNEVLSKLETLQFV